MITILLLLFLFLLLIGIPVGYTMIFSSIFYIVINGAPTLTFVVQKLIGSLNSYTMLAIPFFIIAANLMNELDVSIRIFDFADAIFGYLEGGLAYVNVFASLIFSGMSGSSAADFGGLGYIEIKEMNRKNYPKAFSAAVTAASSAIGPIFPPSVMLVMYGVMTGTSVGRLFMGGVIPGILMTIILMLAVKARTLNHELNKRFGKMPQGDKFSFSRIYKSVKKDFFALITPLILLYFLIAGIVTPSELGIILITYSLLTGFIYKSISFEGLKKTLLNSTDLCGQILFMIATASIFGSILVLENVPQMLLNIMNYFSLSKTVFLILLNVILLILGCFMEGVSLEVLMVPLIAPAATALDIDLVQLGVIMVLAIEIGLITPPFGSGVFVASKIAEVPIGDTFREALIFVPALAIVLFLITIFPELVLWLPRLVFG